VLPQETIRRKRDRQTLSAAEIAEFVAGIVPGAVSGEQVAAFAMAALLNGLDRAETVALTLAMRDSGAVLDWSDFGPAVLDKHSTGGVGDNVSLMLAPAVAACGGFVPMISGRGLGHTGGTLDKLESIPGYNTAPANALFRKVVREVGCAVIGQTADLAPADKRIYAIRDVTATVESVPLITASILSKKLAAGLRGLVLDVKVGSGAFMDTLDRARVLAASLVEVANGAGLKTMALLTDMDRPLAPVAGNGVEVANAIAFLRGENVDRRLHDATVALGGEMLALGGLAADAASGAAAVREAFSSGRAAQKFAEMVAALGGPNDLLERPGRHLPTAPLRLDVRVPAARAGELKGRLGFDTRQIGLAVVELGGGRTRPQDAVDHAVGIVDIAGRDWDGASPVCRILARDEAAAGRAAARIIASLRVAGQEAPPVLERIG
jgi:thymidine phosphorylase